jgi:hypothetical protein
LSASDLWDAPSACQAGRRTGSTQTLYTVVSWPRNRDQHRHRAGRGIGTLSGAKLPEGMRVRAMQAVGIVAPAGRVAEPTRSRKPDALAPAIEETGRFKVLSTDQHGQFRYVQPRRFDV